MDPAIPDRASRRLTSTAALLLWLIVKEEAREKVAMAGNGTQRSGRKGELKVGLLEAEISIYLWCGPNMPLFSFFGPFSCWA